MPATRAAFGFSPTARNWKPRLERLRSHHTTTVATMTRMKPKCRLYCGPSSSGKTAVVRHRRRLRVARPGRLQQARRAQHPRHEVEGDVVEHDRHDHLVRAGPRLEHAGDAGPQRAGRRRRRRRATIMWMPHGRSSEKPTHPAAAAAIEHLAAAADVEHADAERERDAEAGRDQRRREGQRLGERTDAAREVRRAEVVDRALEQRDVRPGDRRPRPRRSCRRAGRRSSRRPPARPRR